MSKYDYLVVGSGLYGAIIPEFLNGSRFCHSMSYLNS